MCDLTKQDIIYHHHNYRILLQNPFSQYSFIKSLSEYSNFRNYAPPLFLP